MTRKQRIRSKRYHCTLCAVEPPFCYKCVDCEFQICQACMAENEWGMSCNKMTWECPDCGRINVL
jgi:hypothetical protein